MDSTHAQLKANTFDMKKQEIKDLLNGNPLFKAIGFFVSVVMTSVLSSALVADITNQQGKIEWSNVWSSCITPFLGLIVLLEFFYYWLVYQADVDIMKYGDDNFCANYIKKECLPALAQQYKKQIEEGKQITSVKSFLDSLNPDK